MKLKSKGISLLLLHLAIVIYSFSSLFMKFASTADFLSFRFFLFYGLAILSLLVYALFWQQILSYFKLSFAYTNKAIGILWTVLLGVIFFDEFLNIKQVIGIALIILGVIITVTADE